MKRQTMNGRRYLQTIYPIGVNIQNTHRTHRAQHQKKKKKNRQRTCVDIFSKKKITGDQQAHEKVLKITNHQGNAN